MGASRNRLAHSACVAALILAAGCAAPAQPAADQRDVRDSAGVSIVQYAEDLKESQRDSSRATWHELEPVVRIGAVDGVGPELFSRVAGAVRLTDGRIVVADGGSNEIRWFASDGAHLVTAGGSGAGPGEFRRIIRIVRAAADSVLVHDAVNRRISVLSPSGSVARLVDASVDGQAPLALLGVLPDGRWLVESTHSERVEQPGRPIAQVQTRTLFLWDGHAPPERIRSDTAEPVPVVVVDGIVMPASSHPLASVPVTTTCGDGWITALHDPAEIRLHAPAGELRRIIRTGAASIPYEDAHLERWFDGAGYGPEQRARFRAAYDQMIRPHALPSHGAVLSDDDGRIWVSDFPDLVDRTADWTVYDNAGRTRVRLPPDFRPVSVADNHLVGVVRDDFDVEHISVLRVR